MRYIKVILLYILMVLGWQTANAYDFMVDGLCYNYNDDGTSVTVTYQRTQSPRYPNLSGALDIPSSVTQNGIAYPVTAIGENSFRDCSGMTSVSIPSSVINIEKSVFSGCSGLTNVTIPNSVTSIGDYAFYGCFNLTSVSIGNSVKTISHHMFQGCGRLSSVKIPNSVLSIGNYAFSECCSLTNITIPDSANQIGYYAFYYCISLTSVTIGKSVLYIGSDSFNNCESLKYVVCKPVIPPYLEEYVFNRNTSILIPTGAMNNYKYAQFWGSYKLGYSLTKVTPYTTQVSFISENKELSQLIKLKFNNHDYTVSNDSIMITDLMPNEHYSAVAICKVVGEDVNDTITFTTKSVRFESMLSSTQTTVTPEFKVYRDVAGFNFQSTGATYSGTELAGNIVSENDDYFIIRTESVKNLNPNTDYFITPWIIYNGKRCEGPLCSITTQNIETSSNVTTGPTNVEMIGNYNAGDAHVKDAYFTFSGQQMKKISVTGLNPSTTYSTVYTVETNTGGTINTNMSFTTKLLTMSTQEVHMLNDTSPMLIATTNMADVETFCGFEWRRYDAPNEMPSTKVYCPVYNGTMAGVLKNMTPNVYYKYRPFYKANNGAEYYGNWVAFLTADAGVSFEPVVYTYKDPEVTQNTAILQGVALPGSSDITEQGFEYWRMSGSKLPIGVVNNITALGQRMSAPVEGLSAGATYGFRSYVKAGGLTYYGSEEQFTTEKPSGDVNGDGRVNVSDVSALINMILGLETMDQEHADVNGDGRVNVSDVTALINIILGI